MSAPPWGDPSRKAHRGRARDTTGSMITPETSDETDPLFGVISARFRTASPDLRRLPLRVGRIALPEAVRQLAAVISQKTTEKLEQYNLLNDDDDDTGVDVGMYGTYGQTDLCRPTVLIIINWEPEGEEVRKKAVREIAEFATLEVRSRNQAIGTIQVDMIDSRLMRDVFYGPVKNQPQLFNCWDKMRTLVRERLESFEYSREQMTAILLFHYGLNEDYTKNPITIYISVDYDCPEFSWPQIIEDIQQNLAKHGFPVLNIHMEHNIGVQMSFDYVPPTGSPDDISSKVHQNNLFLDNYQTSVNLGDSIGAERYLSLNGAKKNPLHGTLGCYVELKTARNQQWETYALTNYHVIRPTIYGFQLKLDADGNTAMDRPQKGSKLWKADEEGLGPRTTVPSARVESPSRIKHNFTTWVHQQQINEIDALADQAANFNQLKQKEIQDLNSKTAFFDQYSHILGKVYAGSGFMHRSSENNRLDWALIKVNQKRIGTNRLPGYDAWKHLHPGKPLRSFDSPLKNATQSISEMTRGQRCLEAFKLGTTTGATAGTFYCIKGDARLKDDAHLKRPVSSEYVFQPRGGPRFAARGDSGSAVYDDQGCIVGLLFTGQVPINGPDLGVGYVTPIEYVFKDIMDTFKGEITDIRVADR